MAAARARRRRARAGARRAGSPTRSTKRLLDRYDLVDRDTSRCARSTGPSRWRSSTRREAPLDLRRVPAHAGRARRAQARARGRAVGDPPRRRRRAASPRSSRKLPFALTGDQQRAIDEITHDMASAAPMHRLLQGDVGSGKTVVALAALLVARAGRVPGRVHGADRGARRAALPRRRCACSTGSPSPAEGSLLGGPAGAGRAAHEPHDRGRAPAHRGRRSHDGEVDILVGTHALLYGDAEFTQPRRRGDRRAAPLRRRAARAAARQGRRARRARDDRDADPAHRGDARLRRPRQVRAARDAARAARRSRRRSSARTRSTRTRRGSSLRDEVEAGHQAYVVCPLVEDKGKVEAKAATEEYERLQAEELAGPAARPAARPDAVEGEGGGDGRRSAAASSTCSSRRP